MAAGKFCCIINCASFSWITISEPGIEISRGCELGTEIIRNVKIVACLCK